MSKLYGTLCKPAQFYLVISLFGLLLMAVQNFGAKDRFTLGVYSAPHSKPMMMILFNVVYIALWTWMLNMLCRINTKISWVIVLFPFILFFIGIGVAVATSLREDTELEVIVEATRMVMDPIRADELFVSLGRIGG